MDRTGTSDHISLDEWKALAHAGKAPARAHLLKQYVAEIQRADGYASRKISFTISTESVDRDRDVIVVEGWDLEAYLKNPVVLWAHSYGMPPVARAESIEKKGKALRAVAEFAEAEDFAFADTVYRLIRAGFIQATSVGFRPIKWSYNEDRRGYDIEEQELLEFSIVPVPANPEALMDAKAAGIAVEPLREWAVQVLDGLEPGLWVPKKTALRVLEIAAGGPKKLVLGLPLEPLDLAKAPAFVVQTLIFPKAKWDSVEACKEWAKDHDFRADKVDETEDSWRLRQRDPGDFKRLRTICINPGPDTSVDDCKVKAVGGPLKAAVADGTKRGRVLSAYSEARIRAAREAANTIGGTLDEVLAQIEEGGDEDDDEGKTAEPPAPPATVLQAAVLPPIDEPRFREVVRSTATEVLQRVIRRAQGRLD